MRHFNMWLAAALLLLSTPAGATWTEGSTSGAATASAKAGSTYVERHTSAGTGNALRAHECGGGFFIVKDISGSGHSATLQTCDEGETNCKPLFSTPKTDGEWLAMDTNMGDEVRCDVTINISGTVQCSFTCDPN